MSGGAGLGYRRQPSQPPPSWKFYADRRTQNRAAWAWLRSSIITAVKQAGSGSFSASSCKTGALFYALHEGSLATHQAVSPRGIHACYRPWAQRTQRKVHADFRFSPTGIDSETSPGRWAVRWATKNRSHLTIRTTECAPDLSTQNQKFRAQQRAYAKRHGITYESVSDGTGLGTTAGLVWQITVDLRHPKQAMYREVGWAQGLSRSDTAELAGMVQQLRRAPDQAGVRLCSDCNGVLLMIERARTARPQTVVHHAQLPSSGRTYGV